MLRIVTNVWRREMGSKSRGALAMFAGGLYDGRMPTIRGVSGPYRLFFYSFDCNEPMHIHAERERMKCKFWMDPIVLASNDGYSPRELNRVRSVIQEYADQIRRAWDEHCPKG